MTGSEGKKISKFLCKLRYLVKATLQSDLRMKNVFSNGKSLIQTIKITRSEPQDLSYTK